MNYSESISRAFPASHVLSGHPRCGDKLHGHTYRVEVSMRSDPVLKLAEWLKEQVNFYERFNSLVDELANRHLNDMIPSGYPTPMGIATWFFERLSIHVPLYEVTVWQDEQRALVRRD